MDDDEYERLFGTRNRQDYFALHRRISECEPFLKGIGVHVRQIEDNGEYEATGGEEAQRDLDHAFWVIEVPAWKHKKGFVD
jgi:hypothetical protein